MKKNAPIIKESSGSVAALATAGATVIDLCSGLFSIELMNITNSDI